MRSLGNRLAALLLAALSIAVLAPAVAQAQTTAPEAETAQQSATKLDLLLDVIEDPESRDALISELRATRETAEAAADDAIVDTLAGEEAAPSE